MKKALSLTFFSVFLLSLGALFLTKPSPLSAYAPNQDTASFEENVYGINEFNNESHSYATTENIIQSLNNMILGCATEACVEKLAAKGLPSNGAVGATSNLIASLYANPPASSAYYLADLGQRLHLTQPAYAQGIGFSGLTPLLPLWRAARNAAYIFFILVFLIIGFAIMFRAKINPQTVVTIQSAIPKAVVALILVTFSYAIAGLMIDLMYLVIGLIGAFLTSSGLLVTDNFLNEYAGMNFFGVMGKLLKEGWDSFWPVVFGIWEGMGAGKVGSKIIGAITGALPSLILGLVLLFLTFKIFFALLMAYIQVIIAVIIAPFQLMLSAIPGQNTFSSWLRNLTQNLLAFPGVILALALGGTLTGLSEKKLWMPPLLGGSINADVITGILSLGILLLTAKIPDMIKSMFEKKPFAAGAAIGEPLKQGAGAVSAGITKGYESLPAVQEKRAKKEALLKAKGEKLAETEFADWKAKKSLP